MVEVKKEMEAKGFEKPMVASLAGDVEVEEAAEYLYQNGIPAYAYSTELPVEVLGPSTNGRAARACCKSGRHCLRQTRSVCARSAATKRSMCPLGLLVAASSTMQRAAGSHFSVGHDARASPRNVCPTFGKIVRDVAAELTVALGGMMPGKKKA